MKNNCHPKIIFIFVILIFTILSESFAISAKPNYKNILNQTHSIIFKREIFISYQKLQNTLNQYFPFNKKIAHFVSLTLTKPCLSLNQKQNRLVVDADITLKIPFRNNELNGKIGFSAIPFFNENKQAIVLQHPKLEHFSIQDVSPKLVNQMRTLMIDVAMPLLELFPIYIFKPNQLLLAGKRIRPEKFVIVDNGVVVHLKIN